jgi:protein NEDD1
MFAAVGECGTLVVWDMAKGRDPIFEKVKAHQGPIRGLAFSPSNKDWFCTVGCDKMLKVHQVADKVKG